jgi:hypothetical protein
MERSVRLSTSSHSELLIGMLFLHRSGGWK